MKYFKRANIYKASNVSFNPETCEAYSYDWWQFVKRLENGKVVFNDYSYSSTTAAHQRKVWSLFDDLRIQVDLQLNFTKKSLTDPLNIVLRDEIKLANEHIVKTYKAIYSPGTHEKTNGLRHARINDIQANIAIMESYLIEGE